MASQRKTVRVAQRRTPSIPPELLADVAKMFAEYMRERDAKRLEVFDRAWSSCASMDSPRGMEQRVMLAVAYLGGSK
jgi:hypothetical protein